MKLEEGDKVKIVLIDGREEFKDHLRLEQDEMIYPSDEWKKYLGLRGKIVWTNGERYDIELNHKEETMFISFSKHEIRKITELEEEIEKHVKERRQS